MKKKAFLIFTIVLLVTFLLISTTYSDTTTRGIIRIKEDGTEQVIEDSSIKVHQTIKRVSDKKITFKMEVENLQYKSTEVAIMLDNSFSMWSESKITTYKAKLVDLVNAIYAKVPDAYMSVSSYSGNIKAMTNNKQEVINAINSVTSYTGINSATGLTDAKSSFTGKAGNEYILAFTDTEEHTDAKNVVEETQNDTSRHMVVVIMGEGSTKQTEYSQVKNTKVYKIDNMSTYNFSTLNTSVSNSISSAVTKELNNITINGVFANQLQEIFTTEIKTQPSKGQLILSANDYNLTIPQMTTTKVSFELSMTLKDEIERDYMGSVINLLSSTSIKYDNNRQEAKTLNNTTTTPVIDIVECYTLEITAINKEFQEIKVNEVECNIIQKDASGNVVATYENKKTNSKGQIVLEDLSYTGESTIEIVFLSTSGPYESKEPETIKINKDPITGAITVIDSTLLVPEGEDVQVSNVEKIISAKVAISPKAIVFNVHKIDEETGLPLQGAKFELKQPHTSDIPADSIISGTTNEQGNVSLSGEVAGVTQSTVDASGTSHPYYYTYVLNEVEMPTGYVDEHTRTVVMIHFSPEGEITGSYISTNSANAKLSVDNDVLNLEISNKKKYYTLNINAIDKEYNKIPVVGAEFTVTGVNESGVQVCNKKGTTNKDGELQIEINCEGKVTYTISQTKEHAAYENASDIQYVLTRDFATNEITLHNEVENISVDTEGRIVTATIPLMPKKFELKVNKKDLDENIPVEGVELEFVQPGIRDNYTLTSGENGILSYTGNVVCNVDGGKSTYYLDETQKAVGYKEIKGNMAINITFDEHGNITEVEENSVHIENVIKESKKVELDLLNEQQEYTVELYAKHKNYKEIPIKGVDFALNGTTVEGGVHFYQQDSLVTDVSGKATSDIIKRSGDLYYTITTNSVPLGYKKAEDKTIKVNKNLKTENLTLLENKNEDVNVTIDNINKIVKVTVYFEPDTFTLQINKKDIGLSDILIGNAQFKVEQPKIKYINSSNTEATKSRDSVSGVTQDNEVLELQLERPVMAGFNDRTFTYTLKEIAVPSGYINTKFELNFDLTFNDEGQLQSITNTNETSQPATKGEITESKDDLTNEEASYFKGGNVQDGKLVLTIGNEQKGATLKVHALDGKYGRRYNVNVKQGVTIQVVARDSNGNEFYRKNLVTDENGMIELVGISQAGDFSIELTAVKAKAGYLPGSTKTVNLHRDILSTEITLRESDSDTNINNTAKVIETKMFIDVQTYDIEITKFEKLYGDTLIENAKFTIIQPDIGAFNRDKKQGTTVKGEKLVLSPEVAGEGTYEYRIVESAQNGYINQDINTTLKVTFDKDGNIQNVEKGTDDKTVNNESVVTLGEHTNNKIPLTIMNEQMPYKIKILAVDAKYSRTSPTYHMVPVKDLKVRITGTTTEGQIYNAEKTTTEEGIIESDDLLKRGDVDYTIEQIGIPAGYHKGENTYLKINKDWDTTEISLRENVAHVSIDNNNKVINVTLWLQPKTFEIDFSKVDKIENDIKVGKAKFLFKQPAFEIGGARNSSEKISSKDKNLVFTGEVAGEGTYTYTLEETETPKGYIKLAPKTNLLITFDSEGVITNVTKEEENEFVKIGNVVDNVIPVQISNEKKVHSLKIVAMNEEYNSAKAEGVHVKLVRKDGQPLGTDEEENPIMERKGITDANGIVIFKDLEGSGDIAYEIIQEEPRPAAFYLGESKTVQVNINESTNDIVNRTIDEVTKVDNSIRQISTNIYLTPKKFTITLNKIDYDNKNLIGTAFINYKEAKWLRHLSGRTVDNEKYVVTGYVPGEGTYNYTLEEGYWKQDVPGGHGIPKGYKNYLNTHKLDITFDENGDIQESNLQESTWFKVFWDDARKLNYIKTYDDLKYHTMDLLKTTTEDIELKLTNVKKQFRFNMDVINSKYKNEKVERVQFRIKAYNEAGNEIYNQINETDENGQISIGDEDFYRVTGKITFTIECLNAPSMFKQMPIATVVINRAEHPDQKITVDQVSTSSHVNVKAKVVVDPVNTSDFSYNVNVEVPLQQKTFDMELTKVSAINDKVLLKGATFTLTQPDGKHTQQVTSDENGKLLFSADLYGENTEYAYILTENNAPTGYQHVGTDGVIRVTAEDEDVREVRVTQGETYIVDEKVENTKKVTAKVNNTPEGSLYNVKLIEKYGNKRVEGSKYNILIDATVGEQINVTDYTDAKGTIEINQIPGEGEIVIKVNELENAPGYQLISGEKIAVVEKNEGSLKVINEKTSEDINVSIDKETKTIIIELVTIPTIRKNKIEFEVVDKNDEDIKIQGTSLNILPPKATEVLYRTTNGAGYTSIDDPAVPGEGAFDYSIAVTEVPSTYYDFMDAIKVKIEYDDEGNIQDIWKIDETEISDSVSVLYDVDNTDTKTTYRAKIIIKLDAKINYNLNIEAQEKDKPEIKIQGAKFEIKSVVNNSYISTSTKKTGKDGTIKTKQAGGETVAIYLKEIETAKPYVLDKSLKKLVLNKNGDTFDINTAETTEGLLAEILEDGTVKITIENELKGANINFQLLKVDSENEAIRLEGVTFKLLDKTNNKEYELATDESGQILLEGFKVTEPGEYDFVVSEISTIEGYNLPKLEEGEEIRFKIVYQEVDGILQVKDIIQDGGEKVITGLSYTQTSTDTEYILQLKLIINNTIDENYKYNVNVFKRDSEDNSKLLSGATIRIKNTYVSGHSVSTTVITQASGSAHFTIPLVPNDNTIEIEEISAPLGYQLENIIKKIVLHKDETTGEVTIVSTENISSDDIHVTNGSIDINIDNQKKEVATPSYQLQITKVDREDETKKLANAKYTVKVVSDDGNFNKQYDDIQTAREGGIAYLNGLNGMGEITITITETNPPLGYIIDKEPKVIKISRDAETNSIQVTEVSGEHINVEVEGTTISVKLSDKMIKLHSKINKTNRITGNRIPNMEFTIAEVIGDSVSEEKQTITTNDEGEIDFTLLAANKGEHIYELEEKSSEEYIKLENVRIKVIVSEDGSVEKVEKLNTENTNVNVKLEDGKIILNVANIPVHCYKQIEIEKVDSENETIKLSGAIFNIVGTEHTTDENGHTSKTIDVEHGTENKEYSIIETKSPIGYLKHLEEIKLNIKYDENRNITGGEIISGNEFTEVVSHTNDSIKIKIKDDKVKVNSKIYKTNYVTGAKIKDVQFTVAEVIDGEVSGEKQTLITNDKGEIDFNIFTQEVGEHIFEIEEAQVENYEAVGKIRIKVVINEDGTLKSVEKIDGAKYVYVSAVDGKLEIRVPNKPTGGSEPTDKYIEIGTKIYKTNYVTGEAIKDIEFTIAEVIDGEVSEYKHKVTTNDKGEIDFNIPSLGIGEHIFEIEEKDTEKYENVGRIRIKVVVNEDGTIASVEKLEGAYQVYVKLVDGKIEIRVPNKPKGDPENKYIEIGTNIYKTDYVTGAKLKNIEFTIAEVIDGTVSEYKHKVTTNEEGEIDFNIPALGVGEHIFEIEEKETENYETVGKIKIKVVVNEDGTIASVEKLEGAYQVYAKLVDGRIEIKVPNKPKDKPESKYVEVETKIYKIDYVTGAKLKDIEFTIAEVIDGTVSEYKHELKTNEEGQIDFNIPSLGVGEHIFEIEEKETDKYETVGKIRIKVVVNEDGTIASVEKFEGSKLVYAKLVDGKIEIKVPNKPKGGEHVPGGSKYFEIGTKFYKIDYVTGAKIKDVQFTIAEVKDGTVSEYKHELKTNEEGQIDFNIPAVGIGEHIFEIEEKETENYETVGKIRIKVVVNEDGTIESIEKLEGAEQVYALLVDGKIEIKVPNKPKGKPENKYVEVGTKIYKIDYVTGAKLKNIEFTIAEVKDGEVSEYKHELKTNEEGQIDFDIPSLGVGEHIFEIEEKETDKYETLGKIRIKVIVNEDGTIASIEKLEGDELVYTKLVDGKIEIKVSNKPKGGKDIPGGIRYIEIGTKIYKTDYVTGAKIKDVQFTIAEVKDGEVSEYKHELTTNKYGEINFDIPAVGVGEHIFEIEEKETENYETVGKIRIKVVVNEDGIITSIQKLNGAEQVYVLLVDGKIELRVPNKPKDGPGGKYVEIGTKIYKTDYVTGAKLKNIEFTIAEVKDGEVSEYKHDLTTNEKGEINFNIPSVGVGEHIFEIEEKETDKYETVGKIRIKVVVNEDGTIASIEKLEGAELVYTLLVDGKIEIKVPNKPKDGPGGKYVEIGTKIYKTDYVTGIKLKDIEFTIAEVKDGVVSEYKHELTTSEEGEINFNIPALGAGEHIFEIEEKEADKYHTVGKIRIKVVVNEDGTIESIEKLEGAEQVYALLVGGKIEIKVPNKPKDVPGGKYVDIRTKIYKTDYVTGAKIKNVQFTIAEVKDGEVSEYKHKITTNEEGEIDFDIPAVGAGEHIFEIEEKETDKYETVGKVRIKVVVNEDGTIQSVEKLEGAEQVYALLVDGKIEIKVPNKPKDGPEGKYVEVGTKIYKTDYVTGAKLKDIEFTIAEVKDGVVSEYKHEITTNEEGEIDFNIPSLGVGEHIFEIEEKESESYETVGKIRIKVIVNEDGTIASIEKLEGNELVYVLLVDGKVEIKVPNKPKDGPKGKYIEIGTKIYKTNYITGERIKNIEFTIAEVKDGEVSEYKHKVTTNKEGEIDFNIPSLGVGEHIFEIEEKEINGYIPIGKVKIKVIINEDGTIQSVEKLDAETKNVNVKLQDGKLVLKVENIPVHSYKKIELEKVDAENEEIKLGGAVFTIDGSKHTTDENGYTSKTIDVEHGTENKEYSIVETGAPLGYLKHLEEIKLNINYDEKRNITGGEITSGNAFTEVISYTEDTIKIRVKDNKIKIQSKIYKANYVTEARIKDIEFTVAEVIDGIVSEDKQEIKTNDKGEIDFTILTQTTGEHIFEIEEKTTEDYHPIGKIRIKVIVNEDGTIESVQQVEENRNVNVKLEEGKLVLEIINIPIHTYKKIELEKVDAENEEIKLAGAIFNIAGGECITDENGYTSKTIDVSHGTRNKEYSIVETKAPLGYIRHLGEIKLNVNYDERRNITGGEITLGDTFAEIISYTNDTIKIRVKDNKIKIHSKIYKTNYVTGEKLKDIEFTIAEVVDGEVLGEKREVTTNEQGEIDFTLFTEEVGEHIFEIEEKETENYETVGKIRIKVVVNEDGIIESIEKLEGAKQVYVILVDGKIEIIIPNKPKGPLNKYLEIGTKIYKTNFITGETIKDIEFTIAEVKDGIASEYKHRVVTNEEGEVNFDIPSLGVGEHIFEIEEREREDYLPIGKVRIKVIVNEDGIIQSVEKLSEENNNVRVKVQDGQLVLEIANIPVHSYKKIELEKVDAEDEEIKLSGAIFNIAGGECITDEDGYTSKTIDVEHGTENKEYSIRETGAPLGYLKHLEEIKLNINYDEKRNITGGEITKGNAFTEVISYTEDTIKIRVKDNKIKIPSKIYKTNYVTGEKIKDIEFTIAEVKDGEVSDEKQTIKTNEKGEIDFTLLTETVGEHIFEIEEKETEEYHAIGKIRIKVVVKEDGTIESVQQVEENKNVNVKVEDGQLVIEITNIPIHIYKKIELVKVDAEDEEIKLSGAIFNIAGVGCITDRDGYTSVTIDVSHGTENKEYSIIETGAPLGYLKHLGEIKLNINYDEKRNITGGEITKGNAFTEVISYTDDTIKIKVKDDKIKIPSKIYKTNFITGNKIKDIEFTIAEVKDGEVSEEKQTVKTNDEGQIDFNIFANKIGEHIFEIQEKETEDYISIGKIRIKVIVNEDGTIKSVEQIEGNSKFVEVKLEDGKIVIKAINIPVHSYKKIELVKVDAEDEEIKLPGAIFNIAGGECITDENGYTSKTIDVEHGTENKEYSIRETGAPLGYLKHLGEIKLNINYDEKRNITGGEITKGEAFTEVISYTEDTIKIKVKDDKIKIRSKIYKKNFITDEKMKDVEFTIAEVVDGEVSDKKQTIKTNEEGEIDFTLFTEKVGERIFEIEEKEIENYIPIRKIRIKVIVNEDGTVESVEQMGVTNKNVNVKVQDGKIVIEIANIPVHSYKKIELEKVDAENEEIKLEGAIFNIAGGECITDENGYTSKIVDVSNGTKNKEYKIVETKAPTGYLRHLGEIKLLVNYDDKRNITGGKITLGEAFTEVISYTEDTIKIRVKDDKIKIGSKIYKTNYVTGERIKDIQFTVAEIVDGEISKEKYTITTNEDGEIDFNIFTKNVGEHIFEIEEKETENYQTVGKFRIKVIIGQDGLIQKVEKLEGSELVTVLLVDEKIEIHVSNKPRGGDEEYIEIKTKIYKINKLTGERIENIEFTIAEVKDGVASEYKHKLITDERGEIDFNIPSLGVGEHIFEIEEIATKEYIPIGKARIKVVIKEDGTIESVQQIDGENKYIEISFEDGQIVIRVTNVPVDKSQTIEIIKVDKIDETKRISGVKFNIAGDEVITDKDGIASSIFPILDEDKTREYVITEMTTPEDYLANIGDINLVVNYNDKDKIIDADITDGSEFARIYKIEENKIIIIVTNEPIKKYSMEFLKIDSLDNTKTLKGAKYNVKLEAEDGYKYEGDITTDEISKVINGMQGYGNIKVTLTEIEAPKGYKISKPITVYFYRDINTKEITQISQSSDLVEVKIEDDNILFILKDIFKGFEILINKVDKIDEKIVLSDVSFLIDSEEYVTDEEGKIKYFHEVEDGTISKIFTIAESRTVKGYEINPEIQLKVDYNDNGDITNVKIIKGEAFARVVSFDNNNINIVITNERIEYFGVEIEKYNKKDSKIKISDTKFKVEITNKENAQTFEVITDVNGIAKIMELTGYGEIELRITEIEAPLKYLVDTEEKVVKLTRDKITKEIKIIEQTGKNITVKVDNKNKIIKIAFADEPIVIGTDILKVDADDNTIVLKDVIFNVKIADKETQVITNEFGVTSIDLNNLERNKVYELEITELKTAKGYKFNNKPIIFTVEIDETGKGITIDMKEGHEWAEFRIEDNRLKITIKNKKIKEGTYSIEIEKQSELEESAKLAKAIYKLWIEQDGETILTEDLTTNGAGIVQIDDLIFNKETIIKLKEEEAPIGYELDEELKEFTIKLIDKDTLELSNIKGEKFRVEIDKEGRTIRIILVDKIKDKFIEIEKVDKDNEEIKLSNVRFKFEDTEGTTNEDGVVKFTLGKGFVNTKKIYTIKEIYINEGYTKLDTPTQIEVEYDKNGNIKNVVVLNNNEYVEFVEVKDGLIKLRFKNEKIKKPFKVIVVKKDKDDHEKVLENAKYNINIKSSDGSENKTEVTTNNKGLAVIDKVYCYDSIDIGLEEIEAPTNYKIDSEKKKINIIRDKTTRHLMINDIEGNNIDVQVNEESNEILITLYDELLTFDLDILKLDKQDESIKLSGVEFEIGGATYTTDIEGKTVATLIVPKASSEYQLTIKESKTVGNYNLIKDIVLIVKIDASGKVESAELKEHNDYVRVTVEDGKIKLVILNEKPKDVPKKNEYNIDIEKVDSKDSNKKLSNARFEILLTKDKNEIINKRLYTNKNGNISLNTLTQDGDYVLKLKEILAPDGYILNSNDIIVVFTLKDGKISINKKLSSKDVTVNITDNKMKITLKNELKDIKLHIEKYVSKVNENIVKNTEPEAFIRNGKIEYNKHDTSAIPTRQNDIVIFNLRIYNEGNTDAYAKHIMDVIPEGLEFSPDHEVNKKYQWKQSSDNIIETDILSKNISEENIITKPSNKEVYYKQIQVAFKVTKQRTDNDIVNIAIIDKATDERGKVKYIDEEDDAKVKVLCFDLSVQKVVNNITVRKDGTVKKTIKGAGNNKITKAEIRAKEIENTTLQVDYLITIRNEGNVKGKLLQAFDYIPEGLSFNKKNNPDWELRDNVAIYKKVREIDVGESIQLVIKLDWNSKFSAELKQNIVVINGEDETNLDNNKDQADVLITVATGQEQLMVILPITIFAMFGFGVYSIKKYVL